MADMRTPGITPKQIVQMHGDAEFNETFFEDVRVPVENVVGEVNRGWYVATTTLDFERSGVHVVQSARRQLGRLIDALRSREVVVTKPREALRGALADTAIEAEVGTWLAYRVAWMQSHGLVPNYEASMSRGAGLRGGAAQRPAGHQRVGPVRGAEGGVAVRAAPRGLLAALYVDGLTHDRRGVPARCSATSSRRAAWACRGRNDRGVNRALPASPRCGRTVSSTRDRPARGANVEKSPPWRAQHLLPEVRRLRIERVGRRRVEHEPRLLGDLVLELPGPPTPRSH